MIKEKLKKLKATLHKGIKSKRVGKRLRKPRGSKVIKKLFKVRSISAKRLFKEGSKK